MQVALPELDGALEPIVFAGRDSNTGKSHSLPVRGWHNTSHPKRLNCWLGTSCILDGVLCKAFPHQDAAAQHHTTLVHSCAPGMRTLK